MLKAVAAVDQATVEFTLTAPYAPFPDLLVLGILPSESLAGTGEPEPVGTGPYRLADWRRGTRMELAANKAYWDGAPAIKKVTVEFIPDDDTRAAAAARRASSTAPRCRPRSPRSSTTPTGCGWSRTAPPTCARSCCPPTTR